MSEPITIIRWTIPQCVHAFGNAPCTAALGPGVPRKCYNSFKTCADRANYEAGDLVLTFAPGLTGLPKGGTVFPILQSVTEQEATVNIAGSDPNMSPFGRRATGKAVLRDMAYHDRLIDKYADERKTGAAQIDEPGYDPETRGKLLAKLKARYPYYAGSKIEVVDGFLVDGEFVEDQSREYIVQSFEKTTPDRAEIGFIDILDVAGNDRAVAPKQSRGRLLNDVAEGLVTFELTPAGIGTEYEASGWASIGSEIVTFTRAGDNITLTGRGLFNTQEKAHKALDTFQQAFRIEKMRVDRVYKKLLTEFAPVPAAYWDDAAAEAEAEIWGAGQILDAIVTKPTAVSALVSEIAPLGSSIWWDSAEKRIGFKINRAPYEDPVFQITDDDIYGEVRKEDRDKDRITDVIFRTVQQDPTKALAGDNFLRGELIIDADAKDPRAFGDQRIKEIPLRWVNQGADNPVQIAAIRYLQRFSEAPTRVVVDVRGDKFRDIRLTDVVELTTDAIQDDTGKPLTDRFQVITRSQMRNGHVKLTLQRYFFDNGERPMYFMENDAPDYDDASDEQKAFGWYWTSENDPEFTPVYTWH